MEVFRFNGSAKVSMKSFIKDSRKIQKGHSKSPKDQKTNITKDIT